MSFPGPSGDWPGPSGAGGWQAGSPDPYQPVAAADPTAVMGRRVLAFLVDAVIGFVLVVVAMLVFHAFTQHTNLPDAKAYCNQVNHASGPAQQCVAVGDHEALVLKQSTAFAYVLGVGLTWWALLTLLEGFTGGRLGKLIFGLRAVTADGQPCGLGRAVIRNAVLVVLGYLCFGIVSLVSAFATRNHQRVGDLLAKTYVVDRRQVGTPLALRTGGPPGGYARTVPGEPPPFKPAPWERPTNGHVPSGGDGTAAPEPQGIRPSTSDQPHWDPARNTYIQYDSAEEEWLEWDDKAQAWKPISS